jgi:hypothetical protein
MQRYKHFIKYFTKNMRFFTLLRNFLSFFVDFVFLTKENAYLCIALERKTKQANKEKQKLNII